MTTPRMITVEHPRIKDQIQVGDILVFKADAGAVAYVQNLGVSDEEKIHANCTHAAVVVGKTFDNIPIISHMLLGGNKTERLDCSPYKYQEFEIHSAINSMVRMEIAANTDLQPEITHLLESTTSRFINKNHESIVEQLKAADMISANGTTIFTNKSGEIAYSKLKVVKAASATILGSSTFANTNKSMSDERKLSTPDQESKFNISEHIELDEDGELTKEHKSRRNKPQLEINDNQMCISLVITAVQETDRKLMGDIAVQFADAQLTDYQAKEKSWSDNIKIWKEEARAEQIESLQIQNRTTDMLPAKLNQLLTQSNAIFSSTSSEKLSDRINRAPKTVDFDGERWEWESGKIGGANVGKDKYTGVYVRKDQEGNILERALIKQDWQGSHIRVAKIIGEGMAGSMLKDIYTNNMGVSANRFAHVMLGRCDGGGVDEDGSNTYLKSTYIKGYQDDLWKYAYREKFKEELRGSLLDQRSLMIEPVAREELLAYLQVKIDKMVNKFTDMVSNPDIDREKIKSLEDDIHHEIDKRNLVRKSPGSMIDNPKNHQLLAGIIHDLAEMAVSTMERPSAIFLALDHTETREALASFILKPPFLAEFAQLSAPRILLGDLGLHNANFGVANDLSGKPHLVSLDYGAAFLNLIPDINPFDNSKTGLSGLDKWYKNHFLEYSKDVVTSVEMAKAFIKLSDISAADIERYSADALNKIDGLYGTTALLKFCKRMGMIVDQDLISMKYDALKTAAFNYICNSLNDRKESLRNIGFQLLLERCYDEDNNKLTANLKTALAENTGLLDFLLGKFKEAELLVHQDPYIKDFLIHSGDILQDKQNKFLTAVKTSDDRGVSDYIKKEGLDHHLVDTALHLAVKDNNYRMVNLLLEVGANIFAKDDEGVTAIKRAKALDKNSLVYAVLKDTKKQFEDFVFAILTRPADKSHEFLTSGANINMADKNGDTALHFAVRHNRPDFVKLLLAGGADIRATNNEHESPLDEAGKMGFRNIVTMLSARAVMQAVMHGSIQDIAALLRKNANVNLFDDAGETPAILAARLNRWDIVNLLLDKSKLDVNHASNDRTTILQLAVRAGELEIVMKILARHPDLSYTNEKQQTVAHLAAKSDYPDAAKIFAELVRHGADVNLPDAKGSTPLQLARASSNEDMAVISREQIPVSAVSQKHKTIAPGSLSVFSHHDKTGSKDDKPKITAPARTKIPGK